VLGAGSGLAGNQADRRRRTPRRRRAAAGTDTSSKPTLLELQQDAPVAVLVPLRIAAQTAVAAEHERFSGSSACATASPSAREDLVAESRR
jgi:hypothetical protein